jgi:hypothetical protein
LCDIRVVKSSILERKVFRIGDVLALRYPMTKSMVGVSPFSGRLTTDDVKKFSAEVGSSATPRVEATRDSGAGSFVLTDHGRAALEALLSRPLAVSVAGKRAKR